MPFDSSTYVVLATNADGRKWVIILDGRVEHRKEIAQQYVKAVTEAKEDGIATVEAVRLSPPTPDFAQAIDHHLAIEGLRQIAEETA